MVSHEIFIQQQKPLTLFSIANVIPPCTLQGMNKMNNELSVIESQGGIASMVLEKSDMLETIVSECDNIQETHLRPPSKIEPADLTPFLLDSSKVDARQHLGLAEPIGSKEIPNHSVFVLEVQS